MKSPIACSPLLLFFLLLIGVASCQRKAPTPSEIFSCEGFTVYADSLREGSINVKPEKVDHHLRPHFHIKQAVPQSVYDRALENLHRYLQQGDSLKVSTRSLAFSIYLSLAYLDPQWSMERLREHTKDMRILQQEPWPISIDTRAAWIIAAWEVYKATGSLEWLKEAYAVAHRALIDDLAVAWQPSHHLIQGETSYLGAYQSHYPDWMTTVDHFQALSLSTNALYAHAFHVLGEMASALDIEGTEHTNLGNTIAASINEYLWIPNLGYYSQYLYGAPTPIQSLTTDNFGQALCVLFDIATPEMAASLVGKTPRTTYGTTAIFPQMPSADPLPTDVVSIPLQGFTAIAATAVQNENVIAACLGSIYREVLAEPKRDLSIEEASAIVALAWRVCAGISFTTEGLDLKPVILDCFPGQKTIDALIYRDAELVITIHGTGQHVASMSIDGLPCATPRIPADLKGRHQVDLTLSSTSQRYGSINLMEQVAMPATPIIEWDSIHEAHILNFRAGLNYSIYFNGSFQEEIITDHLQLYDAKSFTQVAIVPIHDNRWEGFSSQPYRYIPNGQEIAIDAVHIDGHKGTRLLKDRQQARQVVETTTYYQRKLSVVVNAPLDATYYIYVEYSNGAELGMRSLVVNGSEAGIFVMPRVGHPHDWQALGASNILSAPLHQGDNHVELLLPSLPQPDHSLLIHRLILIPK